MNKGVKGNTRETVKGFLVARDCGEGQMSRWSPEDF
jgi:hypothetical protein